MLCPLTTPWMVGHWCPINASWWAPWMSPDFCCFWMGASSYAFCFKMNHQNQKMKSWTAAGWKPIVTSPQTSFRRALDGTAGNRSGSIEAAKDAASQCSCQLGIKKHQKTYGSIPDQWLQSCVSCLCFGMFRDTCATEKDRKRSVACSWFILVFSCWIKLN